MSAIRTETATVYRGGGRRWLTKRAAARAEAWRFIRKRCECEPDVGWVCGYHCDADYTKRLVDRLTRFLLLAMRRSSPTPSTEPRL